MQNKLVALLILLLASVPVAAWAQVYTWTDSSGTVHYSDAPPAQGVKYSQLQVKSSAPDHGSDSSSRRQSTAAADRSSDPSSRTSMADTPQNRKSLCNRLSGNIALLKSKQAVNAPDADGKLHAMSDEQRKSELDRAQSQYHQYCKS